MKTLKQLIKELEQVSKQEKLKYIFEEQRLLEDIAFRVINLSEELEKASPYDQQNILEREFELDL